MHTQIRTYSVMRASLCTFMMLSFPAQYFVQVHFSE